jgi:hypothetical protein
VNSKEIRYAIGKEYVEGRFEREQSLFVAAAYREISRVSAELFKRIPFKVEFTSEDHYESAKQMREEVQRTGVIKIYTGFGGHPYLTQEQNNKGRAVHDVWAHLVCGCPFSFEGEYNAYLEQRKYYPEWTWKVLFAEIPAQTSAYYYMGEVAKDKASLYKGVGSFEYKQRAIEAPEEWLEMCLPLKRDYSQHSILEGLRASEV